jgi:hypothetical protein
VRHRRALRRDALLVSLVSLFWRECYTKTARNCITLHEYVRVYLKMAHSLVPDVDHNTAHAVITYYLSLYHIPTIYFLCPQYAIERPTRLGT